MNKSSGSQIVPTSAGGRPTILQIIPRLDTGGAELSAIEITDALVRAGARALVATEGGRMADRITAVGGKLIIFPAATKNPLRILANARGLAALAHREKVGLIHARSRAPAWSALLAARRLAIPFVTTYHGAYGETNSIKRMYNSVMARADLVIANSRYTADLIRHRYATPAGRVRVIHRGVDLSVFSPHAVAPDRIARLRADWQLAPGDKVVLQAARLTGWKGQRVLIEAAGLLARTGDLQPLKFVLAGDAQGRTAYAHELQALARTHAVGDRVLMPGHVSDMPAAFSTAHLAVVASTEPEAFGRTAAEAQAMGCPVIATDIGAPPETVIDANRVGPERATGWLVPPADPKSLADAIAGAISMDNPARDAMGARARANVASHFTIAAMQRATLAVYDELLGSRLTTRLSESAPATDIQQTGNHGS